MVDKSRCRKNFLDEFCSLQVAVLNSFIVMIVISFFDRKIIILQ